MTIFIIIILIIILYLTYSEVKKIWMHSVKHHKPKHKNNKSSNKTLLITSLGIIVFGIVTYFIYSFTQNIEFKSDKIKSNKIKTTVSKQNKNSSDKKKSGNKFFSKNNNSKNSDKNNEPEEIKETVAYKFFQKYEDIFGIFIAENQNRIITEKNEFEVSIKNNKVSKVKLIYPFEKEVYNRLSVNFNRTKNIIKKYSDFRKYINPLDNSVEILNELIKQTLSNGDSFKHIKTELFEEKTEYFILKVTFEETVSDNKILIKSKIARLYSNGKIKIIN